jgi:F0F1-type ATP synthase membrane subunit b/b'
LGLQAREVVQDMHNEEKLFVEHAKQRLPEETMRKTAPTNEQIGKAFDEAEAAFL